MKFCLKAAALCQAAQNCASCGYTGEGPRLLPFFLPHPSTLLTSTTTRAWGCRWFTSCTMALMPPATCSAVCPWLLVPTQTTTICGWWKERYEAVVRGQAKGALAAHPSPAHLGPDVFQLPILQAP